MQCLKCIGDDDYAQTFIGAKDNNGKFDWYPVVRVEYPDDGESDRYHVTLWVVSPLQARETDAMASALRTIGMDREGDTARWSEETFAALLAEQGIGAPVWQKSGNNRARLLKDAREQLTCLRGLFGFYMDAPVNRIGATGWDAIRGDLLAPLRRERAS